MPEPEQERIAAFEHDLHRRIRGEVGFDRITRLMFSTDASNYFIEPLGVVSPRDTDELQAVVELAHAYNLPILARGAGTSLAGQAVGPAIIIDCFRHLRGIQEIDPERKEALVEPGVVLDILNRETAAHSLQFGPDPATANRATMGGIVANNASGSHSIRYGMSVDHVVSAEVVLSDGSLASLKNLSHGEFTQRQQARGLEGSIYRCVQNVMDEYTTDVANDWPETWRRASGYNLNYLLSHHPSQPKGWYDADQAYPPSNGLNLATLVCGSEGTLAILQKIRIRLVPQPAYKGLVVLEFDEIAEACDVTADLLEYAPSAVELIPRAILSGARSIPEFSRKLHFVQGDPEALLVLEFSGDNQEAVDAACKRLGRGLVISDDEQQTDIWDVRKAGLGLLLSIRSDTKPTTFVEDAGIPVDRLGTYVRRVNKILADHQTRGEWYAHASAGCLHMRPLLNLRRQDDVDRMRSIADAVVDVIIDMKGSVSGEHGDGIARSEFNARLYGPRLMQAFRDIKLAFDPHNRMNPGKVIRLDDHAPRMHEQLRYGGSYQTISLETVFQYPEEGDFAHVVESCSGVGDCLKEGGVMCPSYQATLDEHNSTRSRANVLQAVISGRLPREDLFSHDIYDVLDLCLACKGCKAECPTAVDIARVKSEYLHLYQQEHGVPLRNRLFAEYGTLSKLARPFALLINPILKTRPMRWLLEKTLGVARQRTLPAFATSSFHRWFQQGSRLKSENAVVLFVDTYIENNQPELGRAAVRVLEGAGYEVLLAPGQGCCGRTHISKGLLDQARTLALANLDALAPYAAKGIPIVGIEPSCLATLRDEYIQFFPDDPRARQIANSAMLIEEFLTHANGDGQTPMDHLALKPVQSQVLLHGHCHAKALVGTSPTVQLLEAAGFHVEVIDSGCCGMAGSFGYEAEHYNLSMEIGELHLFPAVREGIKQDARIAAAGMSCRSQIKDGTGATALHPIQLVETCLAVNEPGRTV